MRGSLKRMSVISYQLSVIGDRKEKPFALITDHWSLVTDYSAQLVVDVDAHDVVERGLGAEAERGGAAGVEPLRPAADDARDQLVGLAADARRNLVAGDALERGDLLGDRAGDARHGEVDARPELLAR